MGIAIALVTLGLSITFFFVAGSFPHLAADPGGPALFPRVVAVITAAACIAVLFQEFAHLRLIRGEVRLRLPRVRREQLLVFGAVAALPFAIKYIGFVAATFGFALFVLKGLGIRWLNALLASVVTAGMLYVAYAVILGAILPAGQLLTQ